MDFSYKKYIYCRGDFEDLKNALAEFAYYPSKQIEGYPYDIYKQTMQACEDLLLGQSGKVNAQLILKTDRNVKEKLDIILDKMKSYYSK
ncbi:hypothetical protein [Niabella hibiscisoli]|uniref:hypothetical protein n=1 Tax=Niabella hibiscisoli TaxID=1825928 RepID=UPI001F111D12|nr:hypothetical protein [Niabella hibiscisoli]MCH5715359.1 hypothetical protein [Niabella hibiscisoli]